MPATRMGLQEKRLSLAWEDDVAIFGVTMSDTHKIHATGQTTVKSYQPTAFDELPGAPTLSDIRLTETFSGDIEGHGVAESCRGCAATAASRPSSVNTARSGSTTSSKRRDRAAGRLGSPASTACEDSQRLDEGKHEVPSKRAGRRLLP